MPVGTFEKVFADDLFEEVGVVEIKFCLAIEEGHCLSIEIVSLFDVLGDEVGV